MPAGVRPLAVVAIVAVCATVLSGCFLLPRGGQTADAARAEIRAVAGVDDADVKLVGAYAGIQRKSSTIISISVAEGYEVVDPEAAVRWALATAWSVNDNEPNTAVDIEFANADGTPMDWDWRAIAESFGFSEAYENEIGRHWIDENRLIFLSTDELYEDRGDWPGEIPDPPEGLLALR